MKIGVRIENDWSVEQQLEYAKTAEQLGYDTVWAEGNPFKREPFSMLGVFARETEKVQLGLAVASVYLMHPIIMASMAATVDEISGGRMRLAIGCSSTHALEPLGMAQTKPIAHVREAIGAVRELLKGGSAEYEGEIFKLRGVPLTAATGKKIPIFAAGEAPKLQTMIAEHADGLIFPVANAEYNRRALENVATGLANGGRSREDLTVVAYQRFWTVDDPDADADVLQRLAARLVYRVSPNARKQMGLDEENALKWMDDPSSIPQSLIDELIVVGDVDKAAAGAREIAALGFDELVLDFPSIKGMSHDEQYRRYFAILTKFGEGVLPQISDLRTAAGVG